MGKYVAKRLFGMIPVAFLITVIAFGLLYLLPGDPAMAILGEERVGNKAAYQALRTQLGLDDPIYVQYGRWLANLLHGDMGTSIRTNEPIADMVTRRLPVTIELGILAVLLGAAIALPTAVISAVRPGSKLDILGTLFAMGGVAMPSFWLGILLIFLLSLWLRLLPPSGYVSPLDDFGANFKMMIMPCVAMGTSLAAVIMRQARSALIEVLGEDYITTARSKGLKEQAVVGRHALKNALIPVVTVIGLQVGNILGGAVVTETIFAVPGVGRLLVDSISFRDYPVVQAAVLIMAVGVLFSSLATDLLYAYLDPKIRYR